MNIENLIIQREEINKEIDSLQQLISDAPEGKLISRQISNEKFKHYLATTDELGNRRESYIPMDKNDLARSIAVRDYSLARVNDDSKLLRAINSLIHVLESEKLAEKYLKTHPGAASLILPLLRKRSDKLDQWKLSPYEKSTDYPEDLIYPTVVPGLFVRSKAEADIISRLEFFGIPYHYEEAFHCGTETIHPDFTCRNIQTGKFYYWEHQGKMDDAKYVAKLARRDGLYRKNGIYPWKNLLITTETEDQPLDILWADEIIHHFLE